MLALSFAIEGWNDEAIDTAQEGEPTGLKKFARALALRQQGKYEEGIEVLRRSLDLEDHAGRKYLLALWLKEDAERNEVGAFDPWESTKKPSPFSSKPYAPGLKYDYGHSGYDEPKRLLRECMREAPDGSRVLDDSAVVLAEMARQVDAAIEVLEEGSRGGGHRARFELAVVQSFLSPDVPEGLSVGTDAIYWPKAWDVFQQETSAEEEATIFEIFVRFGSIVIKGRRENQYPATVYDMGMEMIERSDQLRCGPGEIAATCGRMAFLSGDLEIAKLFYEEARNRPPDFLSCTTAKLEEAVVKTALGELTTDGAIEQLTEASAEILENPRTEIETADPLRGLHSSVVRTRDGSSVHVSNQALLRQAIDLFENSAVAEEEEGMIRVACSQIFVSCNASAGYAEGEYEWTENQRVEGILKCDRPIVDGRRSEVFIALGKYGRAMIERIRNLNRTTEGLDDLEELLEVVTAVPVSDVRATIEAELAGEEPEISLPPVPSRIDLPWEQTSDERLERFRESHQLIKDFVEGNRYTEEIEGLVRQRLLEDLCFGWEVLLKNGPFEERTARKKEASRVMQEVGTSDGNVSERAIWVRGLLLRGEWMLEEDTNERSEWERQRSLLEEAKTLESELHRHVVADLGHVCKILGKLDQAEELLSELSTDEVETVSLNVYDILDRIDYLKTAPDRWGNLKWYPKKLLATLTALNGEYTENDLATLSGQEKKFISGHLGTLLEEGMLENSPMLGPIWIDGFGGIRVNPYIEENARRERTHAIESRIIEADSEVHARPVFDSDGEYKIYQTLTETFPNGLVFPNMSPSAIFDYDEMDEQLSGDEFRYFLQSRVDFCVVSTESYLPVVGIEVDSHYHDRQEQKERDRKKDKIFQLGGIPLIRIRRHGTPSEDAVAKQVREEIQKVMESQVEEAKMLRMAGFTPSA